MNDEPKPINPEFALYSTKEDSDARAFVFHSMFSLRMLHCIRRWLYFEVPLESYDGRRVRLIGRRETSAETFVFFGNIESPTRAFASSVATGVCGKLCVSSCTFCMLTFLPEIFQTLWQTFSLPPMTCLTPFVITLQNRS